MSPLGWFDRFDPFAEVTRLRGDINELFTRRWLPGFRRSAEYPPVNVTGVGDEIRVALECPGVTMDELDLSITGDMLTIRGERKPDEDVADRAYHRKERFVGKFVRSIQLPDRVAADKAEARYHNGVLEISIPRAEEAKPRKISIQAG